MFSYRGDALGKRNIHLKMRVIRELKMIGYGMSYDGQDELCQRSSSAAFKSLESFSDGMIHCFGEEHLKYLNENDLQQILSMNVARGFAGCVGS